MSRCQQKNLQNTTVHPTGCLRRLHLPICQIAGLAFPQARLTQCMATGNPLDPTTPIRRFVLPTVNNATIMTMSRIRVFIAGCALVLSAIQPVHAWTATGAMVIAPVACKWEWRARRTTCSCPSRWPRSQRRSAYCLRTTRSPGRSPAPRKEVSSWSDSARRKWANNRAPARHLPGETACGPTTAPSPPCDRGLSGRGRARRPQPVYRRVPG